jgi:protein transport protein SEC24
MILAIDRALISKMDDAKEALQYKLYELMAIYRSQVVSVQSHAIILPTNLSMLPALCLGLLKNVGFFQFNVL